MHLLIVVLLFGAVTLVSQSQGAYQKCGDRRECVPRHLCSTTENQRGGASLISVRLDYDPCLMTEVCCFKGNTVKEADDSMTVPLVSQVDQAYQACGDRRTCVPRHLCSTTENQRGGASHISVRVGYDPCPETQVCCFNVNKVKAKEASELQPISIVHQTDSSDQNCGFRRECVPDHLCLTTEEERGGSKHINIRVGDENCPEAQVCCFIENKIKEDKEDKQFPTGCGYQNIDGVGFFQEAFDDNESRFGEFPWVVAIIHQEKILNFIIRRNTCGGSLITPNVVLTGAHCVQKIPTNELLVRAGEWEPNEIYELLPHQDRFVAKMKIHEDFNRDTLYNNIALLFMRIPFELTLNVNTVCLPPSNVVLTNLRCYATGWGKSSFSHAKFVNVLKKIDLPIVPRNKCETILRGTRLRKVFDLHKSFICAGGESDKDMCTSDGGSPLVCPIPGSAHRFYQMGLVAWGIGCGNNIPGVYVSVPYLRGWIDQQLNEMQVNISYFTPQILY